MNENTVEEVKSQLPDIDAIYDLAELYKVFGDTTRTMIMISLEIKDLSVSQIAETLGMTVSAVSHQLRILRGAKLVKATKRGKEVIYSLDDDHVTKIIKCGLDHVNER